MAVDDLFIPDGVYLKCDQGATVVNLKVNFKKHKLYGEIIATEKDHTPLVNIPSFGACSSTGSACTPTDTYWVNIHEGGTLVQKQKPLLETSFCKCMKGGNIKIFFSEAEAIAGLEADKNERVDKIPYIDAILGKATLGPLNPLFLFTDTEPSDVGRGVRKGIKSTYHGLKQMILHPIDTAKGLGKLAMTGVAGYVPPMTSASFGGIPTESEIKMQQDWFDKTPEQRIADFDKDMGTDLTSTHEGIKAAASEFYDQKIVHGTNAERGVLMGQTAEFIGELVVGSKGAGAAIKSAKGSAVAASATEKLSIAITAINEFVKTTKLGKIAKSIKGIFKVGRRNLNIPQGLTKLQFEEFSKALKELLKNEGIEGKVEVHGSRAKGTARPNSDIDIKVIVNDESFAKLAQKRLSETVGGNKKAIEKTVKNQQRIRARGISETFESNVWEDVFPTIKESGVEKIQISVMTENSPFNTGPSITIK
ncbi:DUF4280 domain-containing protein [Apibacter muscae]|uniref:DUF4280 domain-containing protein n=1 Tax=Apibacter muscae TaxID=2509004 RepID=A0A563DAD1_9FLAO|nr:PAAR-like protein [Apibacter muscae]TWP27052.1 DUF4280 domain-containing protein [Apibacter muscae]